MQIFVIYVCVQIIVELSYRKGRKIREAVQYSSSCRGESTQTNRGETVCREREKLVIDKQRDWGVEKRAGICRDQSD